MPMILRMNLLSMQVCVPAAWSDAEVIKFAEAGKPSGTSIGWAIRRQGDVLLQGAPERARCDRYDDHVHVVLDA